MHQVPGVFPQDRTWSMGGHDLASALRIGVRHLCREGSLVQQCIMSLAVTHAG